jgi:hypothetical protein
MTARELQETARRVRRAENFEMIVGAVATFLYFTACSLMVAGFVLTVANSGGLL